MNIIEVLSGKYSRLLNLRLAEYIETDQDKFNELMVYFFCDDIHLSQRASSILCIYVEKHPNLPDHYFEKIIFKLKNNPTPTLKRNILRLFQHIKVPENFYGEVIDVCFDSIRSKKEPVAIKVFSMQVFYNISVHVPELGNELKIMIEDHLPYAAPGFLSRGRKILKALASKNKSARINI